MCAFFSILSPQSDHVSSFRDRTALRNCWELTKSWPLSVYQGIFTDDTGRETRHRWSLQEGMRLWCELCSKLTWSSDILEQLILINRLTFAWIIIEDVIHHRQHANGRTAVVKPILELVCLWRVLRTHRNRWSANGDVLSCISDVWTILEREACTEQTIPNADNHWMLSNHPRDQREFLLWFLTLCKSCW